MTILISGGHLTPALALIDFIQQQHPQDKIVFVGRIYSQDKLKQLSQEKNEVTQRGLKFYDINAPRVSDLFSIKILSAILKLIHAVKKTSQVMTKEKPEVAVSFGGYVALPVAIAAWLKKIPIITHEQTRIAGTTNRWVGLLAKRVGVAFSDTRKFFPKAKTSVVGMPLRLELFQSASQPKWLPAKINLPILYITGGNQGSLFINQLISQSLTELSRRFVIIHQCGNPISTHSYEQQLGQVKDQLPANQQTNYIIKPWVSQLELAWIYQHADLVVSRAGANSVAELASYQIPAVLIPLPISSHQEQQANADWYQHHFPARILNQQTLTQAIFISSLEELIKSQTVRVDLQQVRAKQATILANLYNLLKSKDTAQDRNG